MSEQPGLKNLILGAKDFCWDNRSHFLYVLKPLLPYILVLEGLAYVVGQYTAAGSIFSIGTAYFSACLALAWHRAVLQGPSSGQIVNPFELKSEDKPFLLVFFALIIVPMVGFTVLGVIVAALSAVSPALGIGGAIVLIAVFIWAVIELMRVSFMLPAKSVGAETSIERARETSKGLLYPLFLSGLVIGILYAVPVLIYTFSALGLVNLFFGWMGSNFILYVLQYVALVPEVLASTALSVIGVTILSRLYQWGVEHNI